MSPTNNIVSLVAAILLVFSSAGGITDDATCSCTFGKLDCSNRSQTSVRDLLARSPPCPDVRIIDLTNNHLSSLEFPSNFSQQHGNATLMAGNNSLTAFESLQGWTGQSLSLENNRIRIINISSFSQHIQHLRVDNNLLTSLDLAQSNQLQHLNTHHNSLEEVILPDGNCSLIMVDFSNNRLRSLPDSLARCSWIMILDVSNNSITEFSSGFLKLMKLRPSQSPRDDDSPQLEVNLRRNPLAKENVLSAIENFVTQEGSVINIPNNDCECSVLRTADRLYAPVMYCVSSMCGENRTKLWSTV